MRNLNSTTISTAPATLATPQYDRAGLTAGIVHFGVGGFHRAHQAMYLDRLMNAGQAHDWAIVGVGVLPGDARMKQVMDQQDCLYTLTVKNPDGRQESRVIGSIIEYLFAPEDPEAVIEKMASQATRIVSLTVTEGGYNFHHLTGEFIDDDPDVVHDLTSGSSPRTTFGLVTEALARRRTRGLKPFTVMSCDNIQGNGDVARKMFTAFANLKDPELGAWLTKNVPFPNSMVDRITPVTTNADQSAIAEAFGFEDEWPVVCEPFEQWVLEDHFSLGRPPFDQAGVQLVQDVEPYELMKLRLLNASHQGMCYFGYLAGYRYAHEAAQDPMLLNSIHTGRYLHPAGSDPRQAESAHGAYCPVSLSIEAGDDVPKEFKSSLLWLLAAASVPLVPMCLVLLLDLYPGTTYTDHLSSAVHLVAAALVLTLRPLPPVRTALPEEHQELFRYALRSGVLPIASLFSDWSNELARGAKAQILALQVLPAGTGLAVLLDVYGVHLDPTGHLFFLSCAAATTALAAAAFTFSAVRLKNICAIEAKLHHQSRLLKESPWKAQP